MSIASSYPARVVYFQSTVHEKHDNLFAKKNVPNKKVAAHHAVRQLVLATQALPLQETCWTQLFRTYPFVFVSGNTLPPQAIDCFAGAVPTSSLTA